MKDSIKDLISSCEKVSPVMLAHADVSVEWACVDEAIKILDKKKSEFVKE